MWTLFYLSLKGCSNFDTARGLSLGGRGRVSLGWPCHAWKTETPATKWWVPSAGTWTMTSCPFHVLVIQTRLLVYLISSLVQSTTLGWHLHCTPPYREPSKCRVANTDWLGGRPWRVCVYDIILGVMAGWVPAWFHLGCWWPMMEMGMGEWEAKDFKNAESSWCAGEEILSYPV